MLGEIKKMDARKMLLSELYNNEGMLGHRKLSQRVKGVKKVPAVKSLFFK